MNPHLLSVMADLSNTLPTWHPLFMGSLELNEQTLFCLIRSKPSTQAIYSLTYVYLRFKKRIVCI